MWVFLLVQVLFIVWIISAVGSADSTSNCGTLDKQTCKDASNVGTGIGVFLIFIFWMIVDFLLAVGYGIYRLAKRP